MCRKLIEVKFESRIHEDSSQQRMKTGLLYGIVASSKTRMRCVFCGVFIPKANKCIEEHIHGAKHKEFIDQMAEHGIVYSNGELYCRPCDSYFGAEGSVASHLEDDDHVSWIETVDDMTHGEFINVQPYLAGESNEATCEVCNRKMICSLQNIDEHINDSNHRDKVADKLRPFNGIFKLENGVEAWCKVCNVYFDNTSNAVLQHIDKSRKHTIWFLELIDLIQSQNVSVREYLRVVDEPNACCNRCEVEFACTLENVEEHINGEEHQGQSIKRFSY